MPPETKHAAHPFTRLSPRGPVKDPSAPTELGQIPTLHTRLNEQDGFEPSLTRDASGQLMHPTLSKTSTRTPRDYRLTQGLSMRLSASRRCLASAGAPGAGPTFFAPESTLLGARPLTPVSPAGFPDGEAGFTFQPMSLRLSPRERRRFPRHRTPSASKGAFLGPLDSPGVATWLVLSTPVHLWLPFFAALLPRAESPWAPPAATGEACLNLTSLSDFCNHTKDRAHQANVRTSREAPFLGLRIPESPERPREL